MKEGVVQQYDPPLHVYTNPNNLFVADFVGNPTMNFLQATATKTGPNKALINFGEHKFNFELKDDKVIMGIRPEFIKIGGNKIKTKVYSTLPSGMETTVKLDMNGTVLTSVVFGTIDYEVDKEIMIEFVSDGIIIFDEDSKVNIAQGTLQ